jgi:hypothetical protein
MTTTALASEESIASGIERLERDGFLLVRNALDKNAVWAWRECLYRRFEQKRYDGINSVGNCYIEPLLKEEPGLAKSLVGHPSVAPYLKAFLGKQCQLRSMRAHLNPGPYVQEWHMDFTDYWDQPRLAGGMRPLVGLCMNTTFYLTDNTPDRGRFTFVPGYNDKPIPAELRPHVGYTTDRTNPFQAWCDRQPHVDLHPMSGDAVVFFSHMPHQGAKTGDDPTGLTRANVVLHYQQNPMYPGVRFVSIPTLTLDALGHDGTFPFARQP